MAVTIQPWPSLLPDKSCAPVNRRMICTELRLYGISKVPEREMMLIRGAARARHLQLLCLAQFVDIIRELRPLRSRRKRRQHLAFVRQSGQS